MFDPKKWISEAPKISDSETTIDGCNIKIRRLSGTEFESVIKAQSGTSPMSPTVLALHYGIVNEKSRDKHFSIKEMSDLYDASPVRAGLLADEIIRVTSMALAEEHETVKESEKNLQAASGNPCSGDGAGATDKTREPPKSVDAS